MMWRSMLVAACLFAVPAVPVGAGEPLVADLSDHRIQITTGFTGTDVLLFGAVAEDGDVVVVVRGPDQTIPVWRKGRHGGIWINEKSVAFERVPGFYAVGSSRPLEEIADEALLNRRQIGVRHLILEARGLSPNDAEYARFRRALIRNMRTAGLFATDVGKVTFLGGRLFRATLFFPANVPTGGYSVEVILVRDGQVISGQKTPLFVSKAGIEARLFSFAHQQPALYGIMAVVTALAAGFFAAYVFRRG